jgi:hypothetical protein
MTCCPSGADDSNQSVALGKRYQKKAATVGMSNDYFAKLLRGVARVVVDSGERVDEDGDGFFERNAVFPKVCLGLLRVPGELKSHRDVSISLELGLAVLRTG